jgi:hypothetical protein
MSCIDYTEILSLGRHILPNGISLIRVGKLRELDKGAQCLFWLVN